MKNSKALKGILLVLGPLLIVLCLWRLTHPIDFFANSGITLSNDVGLLNEVRASGGVVAGFGVLIMPGVFIQKLRFTSTIAVFVLFLSYGLARLFAFVVDGNPGETIVPSIIIEFILGLAGVFALYKYRVQS